MLANQLIVTPWLSVHLWILHWGCAEDKITLVYGSIHLNVYTLYIEHYVSRMPMQDLIGYICPIMNYGLMNPNKRAEMFRRFKEENPNPQTELNYASSFELLVAVMLSAQATDVSVNKATVELFSVATSPEAMYKLGVDGITPYIRTIGLFNTKAKNVIETCRMLIELHDGQVPQTREALEALPGVGRKTANVVLNTAFRQIAMAVDTHIFRVSNRTGLAAGKSVLVVEKKLLRFVPSDYLLDAHHWLILHGRYTCVARTPRCDACIVSDLCDYFAKNHP